MILELLECPCCAKENPYAGPLSASSYGVQCKRCGLTLARTTRGTISNVDAYLRRHGVDIKAMENPSSSNKFLTAVGIHTLKIAVRAWNKRGGIPYKLTC